MPLEVEGLTAGQSMRLTMEMQQMEALVMQASAGDNAPTSTTSSNKPIAASNDEDEDVPLSPRHVVAKKIDEEVSLVVTETSDDQSGADLGSIVALNPAMPAALTFIPPKEEKGTVEYVYAMSVLLLQRLSKALALVYGPVNPALVEGSEELNLRVGGEGSIISSSSSIPHSEHEISPRTSSLEKLSGFVFPHGQEYPLGSP